MHNLAVITALQFGGWQNEISNEFKLLWTLKFTWTHWGMWWHRSWSKLVHVPACCLMGPSHYLNQCWLTINKVLVHSFQGNVYLNTCTQDINPLVVFEIYAFEITATPARVQWVNSSPPSATYMRRWTGSALVQIIVCRLVGAKPLSEPML